jgi:catechol 2,3-dioxygenase-like lactoylglutathione lyase family enzyme
MLTEAAAAGRRRAGDGLRGAPLVHLFVETSDIARQRALLEDVLGLPVIENQFHPPHHRHGLVKYDAGGIILALNLSAEWRFLADESDALVGVFCTAGGEAVVADRLHARGYTLPAAGAAFTDPDGHHYLFRPSAPAEGQGGALEEVRFTVGDLPGSLDFYGRTLGLELVDRAECTLRFATGTIDLVVECAAAAADGRRPRHDTYLPVFYTADVRASYEELRRRGLAFKSARPGFSQIGGTARFADPSGHTFCLYEPSAESLTWGSGPKVRALAADLAAPP